MITKLSLLLVLISAIIHPIWNILLKRSSDKVVFYFHIHFLFTLLFSFLLFIFPLRQVSLYGWIWVLLSAAMHFWYQIFLCRTYELGDISMTYPIIRSSPIFVAVLAFVFLKELPSPAALIGIILVILGAQIINQEKFSLYEMMKPIKKENRRAVLFASMTALFSAFYSAVDKKGVLEINPILFFYLFFAVSGLFFGIYILLFRGRRADFLGVLRKDKYKIALASILEFGSYILILYAFRMSKVAYVVALRQVSVIFGAIFGALFLYERYVAVRIVASFVVFIGVFLITFFG